MNAAQPTMQLVNLTPHALTLVTVSGTPITFQASGDLARLTVIREPLPALAIDGEIYGVIRPTLGEVFGLMQRSGMLVPIEHYLGTACVRVL